MLTKQRRLIFQEWWWQNFHMVSATHYSVDIFTSGILKFVWNCEWHLLKCLQNFKNGPQRSPSSPPSFEMRKLRSRKVKWLARGSTSLADFLCRIWMLSLNSMIISDSTKSYHHCVACEHVHILWNAEST